MHKVKPKKRRPYERRENPEKIYRQMTRDHLDVLQNIEFCIVSTARRRSQIDDKIIASALKASIDGTDSDQELTSLLISDLENARLVRSDVPDTIWINGLKVVLQSVYTHSDARASDRDYLDFVQNYIH